MAVSVVMPALEMAQETGKLVSWKKKEGEQVAKGEMLLEVETDKAVVEIEAQADGILGGVTAKVGDVVPVGQTIAWLLQPGEAAAGGDRADADRTHDGQGAVSRRRRLLLRRHADRSVGTGRGSRPRRAGSRRSSAWTSAACADRVRTARLLAEDVQAAAKGAAPLQRLRAARRVRPPGGTERLRSASASRSSSIGRLMAERTTQSWTTRSALLRDARGRRQRARRGPREARTGDRTQPRRQAHLHRSADGARRARAASSIRA